MLEHAGDVEVIEDADSRIVLRLPVSVVYSPRFEREMAVEIGEFERSQWPTPLTVTSSNRIIRNPSTPMDIDEYNHWYMRGYASFTNGEECPTDATRAEQRAWTDGLNTAVEEDESSDD